MSYDFDKIYDRRGTGCIKWSRNPYNHPDMIPLGIADMDLATPDFVIEGMTERLKHPILGYFRPSERFFNSIINWHKNQFGVEGLKAEEIVYQHSVLGGLATALDIFSQPGDSVILQTPAYFNFAQILKAHQRNVVTNTLKWENGMYHLDLEDFEKKIVENQVKAAIICSPHNPTGRVWTREELEGVVEICYKHQVKIIADEIWSDLVLDGTHTPLHTVSEKAKEITVSLYSPTKTFNMAGLVIGYAIIFNEEIRQAFQEQSDLSHYNNCNLLSMEALIAAYDNGAEWKEALCSYLAENTRLVREFVAEKLPQIQIGPVQGTYLVWLNFSETDLNSDQIMEMSGTEGIYFNDGRTCVADGDKCLRMNAAIPRPMLVKALERMEKAFGAYCR